VRLRSHADDATPELVGNRLVANNLVSFNNRRNANSGIAIFVSIVDADHFARRADEDFRTPRDFRGQCQRDVELCPGARVLVNREVKAARGNVACFSSVRGGFLFKRYPNDDRKRQIISTGCSALCHFPLVPDFANIYTLSEHI
jgi:hypothetical protein